VWNGGEGESVKEAKWERMGEEIWRKWRPSGAGSDDMKEQGQEKELRKLRILLHGVLDG
jgi:hypothetical protein